METHFGRLVRGAFRCESCRLKELKDRKRSSEECMLCGVVYLKKKTHWYTVDDDFRQRLPKKIMADRICRACYTRCHERTEADCVPPKAPEHSGPSVPTEVLIRGLRERVLLYASAPNNVDAISDVSQYRDRVNATAYDLFDVLLQAFAPISQPALDHSAVRTAAMLEEGMHNVSARISATMWSISDYLYLSGLSEEGREFCHRLGFGMGKSEQSRHLTKAIEEHRAQRQEFLCKPECKVVAVLDDFHTHSKLSLPHGLAKSSISASVAHIIFKDVSDVDIDLTVNNLERPPLPQIFSYELASSFLQRQWSDPQTFFFYNEFRSEEMRAASRVTCPYDCRRPVAIHSPTTMSKMTFGECIPNRFKTKAEMLQVFRSLRDMCAEYLKTKYMFVTGDWYVYWRMMEAVRTNTAEFGHFVPIPGAFHIGLNVQEAVLKWYREIMEPLWIAVTGKKRFPYPMKPIQRKYILELFSDAWARIRRQCLRSVRSCAVCPVEMLVLLQLFEEAIPVALDAYTTNLHGSYEAYEKMLLRSLRIFAQLGKENYVHCILMFVTTMEHLRLNAPAVYSQLTAQICRFVEEDIEIFHSMVRPFTYSHRTPLHLSLISNFFGARRHCIARWKSALGMRRKHGGMPHGLKGGENKLASLIKALFEKCLHTRVWMKSINKDRWLSSALGTVNDRALPLPLQKGKGIYGLKSCDLGDMKVCTPGFVNCRHTHYCGHARLRGGGCSECVHLVESMARQVLQGLTI